MSPISETEKDRIFSQALAKEMGRKTAFNSDERLFRVGLDQNNLQIVSRNEKRKFWHAERQLTVVEYQYPSKQHTFHEPWMSFFARGRVLTDNIKLWEPSRTITGDDLQILPVLGIRELAHFWYKGYPRRERPDSERNPEMKFVYNKDIGAFVGMTCEFVGFRDSTDGERLARTAWMLAIAPVEIAEDLKTNRETVLLIGDEGEDALTAVPSFFCLVSWSHNRIFVEQINGNRERLKRFMRNSEHLPSPFLVFNLVGSKSR